MAAAASVSDSSVLRIWRAHGLKPHRIESFKLSNDPHFCDNVRLDVVSARGGRTRWMDVGPTVDTLIARVEWMPRGGELAVQRLSRVQDRLKLLAFSTATGKGRTLLEERDPAWVNLNDMLRFFSDSRFLWASERDSYRHLYLYGAGAPRQLIRGPWEVLSLGGRRQRGPARTAVVFP